MGFFASVGTAHFSDPSKTKDGVDDDDGVISRFLKQFGPKFKWDRLV